MHALLLRGTAVLIVLSAAWSAVADPVTDEANRQRQMASMRAEASRADAASAERSRVQQNDAAMAGRSGPNSGQAVGSGGSGSSGSGWANPAGGSTNSGPQSVVDSYTFTIRTQETTPQMLRRLTAEAEGGDAGAQFNLARIYYTGFEGVPRDDALARRFFGDAARAGHPQSQANYGFFLREGIGGPVEAEAGRDWLKRAADAGNSLGQAQYGFSIWSDQPEQALAYLVPAADAGELSAQGLLGTLYVMGEGVPQDDAKAARYLLSAAEQNEPGSQGLLGGMYLAGRGGGSMEDGYRWLKRGAEGGDLESMRNYGLLLVQGNGYPKDMPLGASFVRRAAVQGDAKAQTLLGDLYNEGLGVPERQEDTIYWWSRAADGGDEEAIQAMADVRAAGLPTDRAPTQGDGVEPRGRGGK